MSALGVGFLVMGIMLAFMGKTNFITNYDQDLNAGAIDKGFAKRLGLIEVGLGALYLICGVISFIVEEPFRLISFIACLFVLIIMLSVNQSICERNLKLKK